MNGLFFLLCLLSTDISHKNIQEINLDGYIEINHFWGEQDKFIGDKKYTVGVVVFDQIVYWRYNYQTGIYDIIHWHLIKFGREKDFIRTNEEKEAHKEKLDADRFNFQKLVAKKNNQLVEDVIVYSDSKWVGVHDFERPTFNHNTKRWESYIKVNSAVYKITALSLVESDTIYDPEVTYRNTLDGFVSSGQVKISEDYIRFKNPKK